MAKCKAPGNVRILTDGEIINLFFEGRSLDSCAKYVSNNERTKIKEARQKVTQAIYDYYMRKGWQDDEKMPP